MRSVVRAPSPRVPPVAPAGCPDLGDAAPTWSPRDCPNVSACATFDVAHTAGRKICISVSLGRSSLAGGGSLFPPCLRAFSPAARNLPRFPHAPAARAWPSDCRFLFGRGSGRSLRSRPIALRRLPSQRGSCSLRSHSPRHASRRAHNLSSVECRGCAASRSIRSRVNKKKSVRLERPCTDNLWKIVVR